MGGHIDYEFPEIPSVAELDENRVPLLNRDSCASHLINYYKCLNKGSSFCSTTKEEFYKCEYFLLKKRFNH